MKCAKRSGKFVDGSIGRLLQRQVDRNLRVQARELMVTAQIVEKHLRLTHDGALLALNAAIEKAKEMDVPQCISIVDDGGNLLAFVRMDGARFLSIQSSLNKAVTAASLRRPTGRQDPKHEIKLAVTTGGRNINLLGGVPVIVESRCIGAIGVGSGTGEQDEEVALAAVASIPGAICEFP